MKTMSWALLQKTKRYVLHSYKVASFGVLKTIDTRFHAVILRFLKFLKTRIKRYGYIRRHVSSSCRLSNEQSRPNNEMGCALNIGLTSMAFLIGLCHIKMIKFLSIHIFDFDKLRESVFDKNL